MNKGGLGSAIFRFLMIAIVKGLLSKSVTKMMNLDDKKFEPRTVRYAISNAKNLGLSPLEYGRENNDYRGRVIAEVYEKYQDFLSQK